MQYKQQANPLLSMHNYTPLVISVIVKNKQLILLSQSKLALAARNMYTFCVIKSLEYLKSLINGPVLYLGLKLTIHVIKSIFRLVTQSL